ncbi:hypothetical protein JF116_09660 [Campylobacter fetus subsp. venerealis]|uniref:hypothetical protein n=1 Tax=Campylobacter fetus TaxID=196 RepID=UPI00190A6D2D|nr:hypothetical protein [Campylobacter fetus]MBK3487646.1 hypothetical protein [Campylobacter fetus subsp. venerealis]
MKESLLKELEQCKRSDIADIVEYFKNDEEFFNNILADFVGTDMDMVENYMKNHGLSAKSALRNSIVNFKDEIQEEMEEVRELYAQELNAIADKFNLTRSDISPELADYLKESADYAEKELLSGERLYSLIMCDINRILKEKGMEIREYDSYYYDGINSDFAVFYSPGGNKVTEYIGYDDFESYAETDGRIYTHDIISGIKNESGVDIDELSDEEKEILFDIANDEREIVLNDLYGEDSAYLKQLTNSLAECGIDNDVAVVHKKGKDWYVVPVFEKLEPFKEVDDSVMARKVLTPEQIEQADKCVRALKETVIEDIVDCVTKSEFFQEILESTKKQSSSRKKFM